MREPPREDGEYIIRVRYPQRQTDPCELLGRVRGVRNAARRGAARASRFRTVRPVRARIPRAAISARPGIGSHQNARIPRAATSRCGTRRAPCARQAPAATVRGPEPHGPPQTVSGDLASRSATGPLIATTTSGDVVVNGASDSIVRVHGERRHPRRCAAPRGDRGEHHERLDRRSHAGGARASNPSSGDVALGLTRPLRRAEISSASGDVERRLLPAVGLRARRADLERSARSCPCRLEISNVDRKESRAPSARRGALKLRTLPATSRCGERGADHETNRLLAACLAVRRDGLGLRIGRLQGDEARRPQRSGFRRERARRSCRTGPGGTRVQAGARARASRSSSAAACARVATRPRRRPPSRSSRRFRPIHRSKRSRRTTRKRSQKHPRHRPRRASSWVAPGTSCASAPTSTSPRRTVVVGDLLAVGGDVTVDGHVRATSWRWAATSS